MSTRSIVTDIEGTTSSIDFVHQTLFPYAARELAGFVRSHGVEPAVRSCLAEVDALVGRELSIASPGLAGARSTSEGSAEWIDEQIETLKRWIAEDRKATPLKTLQGMIWRVGFESGELRGHVYDDVPPALQRWHALGITLFVYSSGSEEAQRLLFGHSIAGDLTPVFSGYFDTRVGAKADAGSYERIQRAIGCPAADILFLSDVAAELDAARAAGMTTCQLVRDSRCVAAPGHPHARTFDDIDVPR